MKLLNSAFKEMKRLFEQECRGLLSLRFYVDSTC